MRRTLKKLIILAGLFLATPVFAGGTTTDPTAAGTAAGNSALQAYGSSALLQKNIFQPMTHSNSQLSTLDGSKTFSAALGGGSSSKFLQVLIQPSATGDLGVVDIFQDLNMSGTLGAPTVLGVPVSGVCANGFISCQPGTWNNCQPYAWVADSTGKLSFSPVGITSLGGCYCINASCSVNGQNLSMANSSIILNNLGGGMVAAIQKSVAGVAITNVSSDTVTITYYGQMTQQASTATTPSTSTLPTASQAQAYYTNSAQLDSDSNNIGATQGSDPNSLYSLMSARTNNLSTVTCTLAYTGRNVDTQQSVSNTGQATNLCVDNNTYIKVDSPDNQNFTLEFAGTGPGGLSQIGSNCGGIGWVPITTASLPPPSSTSNWKLTSAAFTANISPSSGLATDCNSSAASIDAVTYGVGNAMQTNTFCTNKGAQNVNITWSSLLQYTQENYQETFSDGCTAYEPGGAQSSNCKLQTETIDNSVTTVSNYNSTGLQPLATCQTFPSQVGSPVQVCKPWWTKTRTYTCTVSSYDFTDASKRFMMVGSSTAQSGTAVNYTDYSQNSSGQWATSQGAFQSNTGTPGADCELACKVNRARTNTQVGTTGLVVGNLGSGPHGTNLQASGTTGQDTVIMTCQNGSCPMQAGDVLLQDCTCLNDFDEAGAIVQTMRLAGADMICSSGTPQPPNK